MADRYAIVAILDAGPDELESDRVEDLLEVLSIDWRSRVYIDPETLEERDGGTLVFEVRPVEIVEDAYQDE